MSDEIRQHRPSARTPRRGLPHIVLCALVIAAMLSSCAPLRLGHPFRIAPSKVKVGHDQKRDVIAKMGPPYRSVIDKRGQEVLTYVWADGRGGGEKCLIVLNKNGIVSVVEVVR